jgi:hypothetical protein
MFKGQRSSTGSDRHTPMSKITLVGDDGTPDSDIPPISLDDPNVTAYESGSRICKACQLPIPDELSGGRLRKYHEECRPAPGTSKSQTTSSSRKTNVDTLINQMADFHRNIGLAVGFIPTCSMDGMLVAGNADGMAESWRPLIEKDPKIRKAWEKVVTGSGWGTVIMAYSPIALGIATNHGLKLPGMYSQPEATSGE